jgi:GAF domain-containing protein
MNGSEICRAVDRLIADGAGLETILSKTVELLHHSNEHFHWTGIYELYPDEVLRLGPFIGAPTDHVFIAVGRGVCGTAVAERRNIVVPDVAQAPNYLACSTATRSELVVLIRQDERIFAQIDIDSHDLDAFDPATVAEVEQVAQRLARAYARSDPATGSGQAAPAGSGQDR